MYIHYVLRVCTVYALFVVISQKYWYNTRRMSKVFGSLPVIWTVAPCSTMLLSGMLYLPSGFCITHTHTHTHIWAFAQFCLHSIITARAVALHCSNAHVQSQWERANFDPPQWHQNPWLLLTTSPAGWYVSVSMMIRQKDAQTKRRPVHSSTLHRA